MTHESKGSALENGYLFDLDQMDCQDVHNKDQNEDECLSRELLGHYHCAFGDINILTMQYYQHNGSYHQVSSGASVVVFEGREYHPLI